MAFGDVQFSDESGLWDGSTFSQPISSYIGSSFNDLVDFAEFEYSKGNIVVGVIPYDVSSVWDSEYPLELSEQ